VNPVHSLTLCL